jgi:uncharacterized lipoprotein YajG
MKKIILTFVTLFVLTSCSKDKETPVNTAPTNIGSGKISFYAANTSLSVKATESSTNYLLEGIGKTENNEEFKLTINFKTKPTAGNYIVDKEVWVTFGFSAANSDIFRIVTDQVVKVTVNDNRIEASFEQANFRITNGIIGISANMYVD